MVNKQTMSDEIKCPVCGKVGIPDYHTEDTVCPQCGSDLSIFRVIDQIPQGDVKKRNVWMPIAAVAILTTAVLGGIMLFQDSNVPVVEDRSSEIACLQDSIKTLNAKIENIKTTPSDTIQSEGFKYVVREGDTFWSISRRFYHTGTRFEEITAANGLDSNSTLNVGDTIIIK